MPIWLWIVLAVVALAAIIFAVGLLRSRRQQVSLREKAPERELPPTPSGGGYRASSSISFSSTTPAQSPAPSASTTAKSDSAAAGIPSATPTDGTGDPDRQERQPAMPQPATPPAESADSASDDAEKITAAAPPETDSTQSPAVAAPAPTAPELDDITPPTGRLSRLRNRLSRSQSVFGRSLLGLLGAGDLDEASWEEIEDTLLMADLGSSAALEVADQLREKIASGSVTDTASARSALREVLIEAVGTDFDRSLHALPSADGPAVILMVGVNGTGKTTTTGKLSRVLVADGRSVVLGAADTFRAAAADQLATWAERTGSAVVRGAEGGDPAAVAFDTVKTAKENNADTVLIDTAGRLHTKTGLMDQLGKVKRVVEKQAPVTEVLLVLDATTGQNGLAQAKVFSEVVDVTGIALTKLDGTAKGGIVIAVQRELGVPVKLVGLGEGPDDLAPFEPEAFVDALLGD